MKRMVWMVAGWALMTGCGGEGGGVSDEVVQLCASACDDLSAFDECSDAQTDCTADCEAVAAGYDDPCATCIAQSSESFASDACSDGYPGCEDQIRCEYTIAKAADCSDVCE
jgi:hypothetical protein